MGEPPPGLGELLIGVGELLKIAVCVVISKLYDPYEPHQVRLG